LNLGAKIQITYFPIFCPAFLKAKIGFLKSFFRILGFYSFYFIYATFFDEYQKLILALKSKNNSQKIQK